MDLYGWITQKTNESVPEMVEKRFSEWLYGEYDENKYRQFSFLYSIPGLNSYMDYLLDKRAVSEYFNRYGMTYSDIHDPRKLKTTQSSGRLMNYVSNNLSRLYR